MTKVPCNQCGVAILPDTAKSNGGICMACRQGIRESIEESRAYCEKLKEYDPVRALWESLVSRSSLDKELSDWTRPERNYFAVCLLEGEVYNGGFDQYFSNSSSNYFEDAVLGLQDLNALETLELVETARQILFDWAPVLRDRKERWQKMKQFPQDQAASEPEWSVALGRIDEQFWDDPDNLGELLERYAQSKGLLEAFQ